MLNRLDNETGGLVLFAKTDDSFIYFSNQMKTGKIEKIYTACVDGVPTNEYGIISYPIAHHFKNKKKMVAVTTRNKFRGVPREAKTLWKLIKTDNKISLLELRIFKGSKTSDKSAPGCIRITYNR